jgi:ADP-heptose:LPS heptosyltransferase
MLGVLTRNGKAHSLRLIKNYMKILIFEGQVKNAKSYPFWSELFELLKGHELIKIETNLPLDKIKEMINDCDIWISIDSFIPHLAQYHKLKTGIVLWGMSDPEIFGYKDSINLIKDRKYLRKEQFKWWKDTKPETDIWVLPEEVVKAIEARFQTQ